MQVLDDLDLSESFATTARVHLSFQSATSLRHFRNINEKRSQVEHYNSMGYNIRIVYARLCGHVAKHNIESRPSPRCHKIGPDTSTSCKPPGG